MATIREMALMYAPHPTENNWDKMQKQLTKLSAYEIGAKDVLKEIEMILNADCILGHPFPTLSMRLVAIEEKIKELKGE